MSGNSLRIGLVTGEYPPMVGGVGAFTRILARELALIGHTVHVFSDVQAREDDPRIHLSAAVPHGQWHWGALRALRHWSQGLDVVGLQFQTAAFAMSPFVHWLPSAVKPVAVITTFHDLRFPYLFPKAGPLRPWIVRRLAHASAGVIATNHEDFTAISRHPHATMIPIGSNILAEPAAGNRTAWRQRLGISPDVDTFLIAFFGFVNRSKGLDTLIDAVARGRQAGRNWHLLIIGDRLGASDPTNRAYVGEIEALIAGHHLEDHVTWTGQVAEAEVAAYLRVADAIALPFRDGASYRRGTLMAALHAGAAIVTTTPQFPLPEFRDGDNMLLVTPDQADQLEAAVVRIQAASDLQQRLSAGARVLAQQFGWGEIAVATSQFYQYVTLGV